MTETSSGDDAFSVIPRRAVPPVLLTWIALIATGALVAGAGAAFGAAAGGGIATAFLASTFYTLRLVKRVDPRTGMFVALLAYLIKITLLAVAVIVLNRIDWLSGPWVAGTAGVCTVVWVTAIILAFRKLRLPVFDVLTGRSGSRS